MSCVEWRWGNEAPVPEDPEWLAFLLEHPELVGFEDRTIHGDPFYFWMDGAGGEWHWYRYYRQPEFLLQGVAAAQRRAPEGATAREVAIALWGPDEDLPSSVRALAQHLARLARSGHVREERRGKPLYVHSRWLLESWDG